MIDRLPQRLNVDAILLGLFSELNSGNSLRTFCDALDLKLDDLFSDLVW